MSLTFHALGKLPGPLIKWFLTELGNDGLVHLIDGYADRSATACVLFGFYDGTSVEFFEGSVKGSVATSPRGSNGFGGWDPTFIPDGHEKTWAEMSDEEQKQTSMRRIALTKLHDHLQTA